MDCSSWKEIHIIFNTLIIKQEKNENNWILLTLLYDTSELTVIWNSYITIFTFLIEMQNKITGVPWVS